jgi:cold shock CspA family protein
MTSSIGCVKCFSPVKGYGFLIDVDTKEELFVGRESTSSTQEMRPNRVLLQKISQVSGVGL